MRFAITAPGSAGGRTIGKVVGDIVRYLQPRPPERQPPDAGAAIPSGVGASSYYADRGTEPGRWLGQGALESGLVGTVASEDFARVLAGRDPFTDTRLITAQGSAGRRPSLGVGQHSLITETGERLYSIDDAHGALARRTPQCRVPGTQR